MVKDGRRPDALFVEKAVVAGAEVRAAADEAAALQDVRRILDTEKIEGPVVCAGDLFDAARGAGIAAVRPETPEEWLRAAASVVRADYGIAETGTLVRFGSDAFENNAWMLPPHCFCFVDARAIVVVPEDLAPALKACFEEDGNEPRGAFFVTGPSRTADIECLLTLGVHGPSRVEIYLLDGKE
ncbi:MAG: LUD domain-containing protein [Acidobacteriota bacterium]|nr:LUD domain-containing protein [Acidobacteriota bacterium]